VAFLLKDQWLVFLPSSLRLQTAPVAQIQPVAAPATGQTSAEMKGSTPQQGTAKPSPTGSNRAGSGPAAVRVAPAEAGSLPVLRQSIGTVVASASTALASQTAGFVLDIHVQNGARVKAGDVLISLDDRAIQAVLAKDRATLARDEALLDDARRKLESVQKLVKSGVYNKQQGDDAEAAVRAAEAAVVVDRAVLAADDVSLSNTRIKAPFDGQLGAIAVSRGSFVAPGTPLVTLTDMAEVQAEFTLSESDLPLARQAFADKALSVSVTPAMAETAAAPVSGPVVFIDTMVDAGSGTFKLRAKLDNGTGVLWPGQALSITVHAGDRPGLVLIPVVAIIQTAQGPAVYVVKADQTAELRPVTLDVQVGDMAGVASGLAAGETVVVEGQQSLANGAPVRIADDKNAAKAAPGAPDKAAKP
jgi:RND family efflux transporter MFP subunit